MHRFFAPIRECRVDTDEYFTALPTIPNLQEISIMRSEQLKRKNAKQEAQEELIAEDNMN
jgi:hypothetical protein